MSVLDGIGNTPLVELSRLVPHGSARVFAKLEWANPTGSMKDRVARAMVDAAELDGRLRPGGTVVEYTSGTTGISLAFVCAAKGYRARIVYSDAFSAEKGQMMRALGADVIVVPADGQGITAELIRKMIDTAATLADEPGHWWSDQLRNEDAIHGYIPLGDEIWHQRAGQVDAFIHAVGTAHSLHGVTAALKRRNPRLHVVAVEPAESPVLSAGRSGAHQIEGIGIGFVPPLWRPEEVDEIATVSTADAKAMARRLASEEGIFTGPSSAANIIAALRLAERLGPGKTIATLVCDSGLRYLSTDTFRAAVAESALPSPPDAPTPAR